MASSLECNTYFATPYEVFKELTGVNAVILVKGIRLWVESAFYFF